MAIKEFAEHLAVKGLSNKTMRAYLGYYKLFDAGLEDVDLTQAYINRFLIDHPSNVARTFVKHLIKFYKIPQFNVEKLSGRKGRKERKSISPSEIGVLRSWLYYNKHIKFLICFDITFHGALRREEVLGIRIKDFNLKEWIEDRSKKCSLLIHGKNGKDRYVPIPSQCMEMIIDYIKDKNMCFEDRLFDFKKTTWHDNFKEAVKLTMDYNYTLHDLRRTKATRWIEKGIDVSRVKERLGHESIQSTQLYINLDKEKEFMKWSDER